MSDRASIFDGTSELDLSEFVPKQPSEKINTPPESVRAVAENTAFVSREAPLARATSPRREPRRYTTGRNVQLNIKVRQETLDDFYGIADAQEWILGKTFEKAIHALKAELARNAGQGRGKNGG